MNKKAIVAAISSPSPYSVVRADGTVLSWRLPSSSSYKAKPKVDRIED